MNLQDQLLQQLLRQDAEVRLSLMDGVKLTGRVRGFDNFTLLLETSEGRHLVYKHAISAVAFTASVQLPAAEEPRAPRSSRPERGERPEPAERSPGVGSPSTDRASGSDRAPHAVRVEGERGERGRPPRRDERDSRDRESRPDRRPERGPERSESRPESRERAHAPATSSAGSAPPQNQPQTSPNPGHARESRSDRSESRGGAPANAFNRLDFSGLKSSLKDE